MIKIIIINNLKAFSICVSCLDGKIADRKGIFDYLVIVIKLMILICYMSLVFLSNVYNNTVTIILN